MSYTPLYVHSAYSLLQSTISLPKFVDLGKKLGYHTLTLTDHRVLHGALEFYQLCQKAGLKSIIGCLFHLDSSMEGLAGLPVLVYPKDYQGFQVLMQVSTQTFEKPGLDRADISLIQAGGDHLFLAFPSRQASWPSLLLGDREEELDAFLDTLEAVFPKNPLGLGFDKDLLDHDLSEEWLDRIQDRGFSLLPMQPVYYLQADDHFAWKVLQAIDSASVIEPDFVATTGPYYLPEANAVQRWLGDLYEGRFLRGLEILTASIQLDLPINQDLLPKFPLPKGQVADQVLKDLCQKALDDLDRDKKEVYQARLDHELSIIHQMGFDDYFLIVWDIVSFAKQEGIETSPGRGSAAGSLVAYLLGITQVDPIAYDLIFERFLNPERRSKPDIDLDFPDNQRERIFTYVGEKYGPGHVAHITTFATLASRQVMIDVCKVFGMGANQSNLYLKALPHQVPSLEHAYETSLAFAKQVDLSKLNRLVYDTACRLQGLPRQLGTHAAGVVISEQPLVTYLPLVTKGQDLPATQYAMADVEKIGLVKMDFLGLKNLTILHDSLELVKKIYHLDLQPQAIPLDDPSTLDLFQKAQTVGVFQFESAGIRQLLKRVKPTSIEDIAAVNALYRPGPMDQIPEFVKRKHGQEAISYPHPSLENLLKGTYGVMVYQEQVMQATNLLAGYSLGQADQLRRAISKKDRKVMEEERVHFVQGAMERGIKREEAQSVFHYIETFANYGFNRAHAFAYSFLAFQLAYLKVHYPMAFYTALLRAEPANSSRLQAIMLEARQRGVQIANPSINQSMGDYQADQETIWVGLSAIKGIRRDIISLILSLRHQYGDYTDFMDFAFKLGNRYCKPEILEPLIQAGVFDAFGYSRATLMATIPVVVETVKFHGGQIALDLSDDMQPKYIKASDWTLEETIQREMSVLGFPVSPLPVQAFKDLAEKLEATNLAQIYEVGQVQVVASIISHKVFQTKKGQPMASGVLQDASGEMNFVVFPSDYPLVAGRLKDNQVVMVKGKANINQEEWQIQVNQMVFQDRLLDWRAQMSQEVYLKIGPDQENSQVRQQIYQLAHRYPGYASLYFFLESRNQLIKVTDIGGVQPHDSLLQAYKDLLGLDRVRIIQKENP